MFQLENVLILLPQAVLQVPDLTQELIILLLALHVVHIYHSHQMQVLLLQFKVFLTHHIKFIAVELEDLLVFV